MLFLFGVLALQMQGTRFLSTDGGIPAPLPTREGPTVLPAWLVLSCLVIGITLSAGIAVVWCVHVSLGWKGQS